jgi:hypothetical protein
LIKLGIVEIDSANMIVRDSLTSFLLLQPNSEYASISKSLYHRLIYLTIASHLSSIHDCWLTSVSKDDIMMLSVSQMGHQRGSSEGWERYKSL